MVFNEVDCNLYFIARDKFIQHDIIIRMGIGILSFPRYCIKNSNLWILIDMEPGNRKIEMTNGNI